MCSMVVTHNVTNNRILKATLKEETYEIKVKTLDHSLKEVLEKSTVLSFIGDRFEDLLL